MLTNEVIAAGNFFTCLAIAIMCILQIGSDAARRCFSVWAAYTLVLVGAGASGLQALWWGQYPTPGNLVFSVAVLVCLLLLTSRKFHNRRGDDA